MILARQDVVPEHCAVGLQIKILRADGRIDFMGPSKTGYYQARA